MSEVEIEINNLFKPVLDRIKEVKSCNHNWSDKDGSAYYRCSKCGYLADGSKELDRLISMKKFKDKGLSNIEINNLLKYI